MDLKPLINDVVVQLKGALEQQSEVTAIKNHIDEQVESLLDAVKALRKVYGGELPDFVTKQIDGDLGITDQVREVIKPQGTTWLSPVQVRDLVSQRGFSLAAYSNPMAVVHQVLKRLEKQGELEAHPSGGLYRAKKS